MSATPRAFAVWFSDLERWDVAFFRRVQWHWPPELVRPIGDALKPKRVPVDSQADPADLPIIEKISFSGTISITPPARRKDYKGRLFWAAAGDLVFSKIRVKQGSIAVVPETMPSLAVSAEYPVYEINRSRADGRYLELVVRSSTFLHLLDGLAHGGSTKTRIPPDQFERQSVPMPHLAVQRAIVAVWEAQRDAAARTEAQMRALEEQIETDFLAALGLGRPARTALPKVLGVWWADLERWSVMYNQLVSMGVDLSGGKYPVAALGDIAAVSYGIQKCPANRPGQHARPYLRVANVQRGELDLREVKRINVPDADMPGLRLEPGDLLFVEGNGSRAELGRCALWRGEIPDCVHQNHILRVRADRTHLLPEYALTWFNTQAGRDHFFRSVKTSSGLGTINSSELRRAPVPLPPLDAQRELIARVAEQRRQIADLRAEAERKAEQANALVEGMVLGTVPVPGT